MLLASRRGRVLLVLGSTHDVLNLLLALAAARRLAQDAARHRLQSMNVNVRVSMSNVSLGTQDGLNFGRAVTQA